MKNAQIIVSYYCCYDVLKEMCRQVSTPVWSFEKWAVETQAWWNHHHSFQRISRDTGLGHYLGVLVDLGDVLLIAVNVQSNGGPRTSSATQSKDDARTICKNEPKALEKISRDFFPPYACRLKAGKLQEVHWRSNFIYTWSIKGLDPW